MYGVRTCASAGRASTASRDVLVCRGAGEAPGSCRAGRVYVCVSMCVFVACHGWPGDFSALIRSEDTEPLVDGEQQQQQQQ